jgi:hypothetical protein
MSAAREQAQHAGGVGRAGGFAENVAVEGNGGIGAENHELGKLAGIEVRGIPGPGIGTCGTHSFLENSFGLFAGQAGDVGDGVFTGPGVLGNVGGVDHESVSSLGEEFAAAGRGGGEDEHRKIIAGMEELVGLEELAS